MKTMRIALPTLVLVISVLVGVFGCTGHRLSQGSELAQGTNHWPAIKKLVEAKRYADATRTAVDELSGNYPDRQYAMWKWWETMFGERKDYREMSRRFGDGLFDVYEQSTPARRRIVTEIFGRPNFDVTRSSGDLRREVERKTTPEKDS